MNARDAVMTAKDGSLLPTHILVYYLTVQANSNYRTPLSLTLVSHKEIVEL